MSDHRAASRLRPLAVLLAVCALLLSACGSHPSAVPAPGQSVGQQADLTLSPGVAQAQLISSAGKGFTLASLRGKVIVLSDMMTLCQETCPLDTANIVAAARAVDKAGLADKVEFVSLTIDPERDTIPQLTAFRRLYAPAPANWVVATASAPTLTALWKSMGVYIQRTPDKPPAPRNWRTGRPLTYDLTHSDEVFFIGADGHERFLLEGAPHVAAGAPIPTTLKNFLDAQGHKNITNPDAQAWTLPQELQVVSWLADKRIPGSAS